MTGYVETRAEMMFFFYHLGKDISCWKLGAAGDSNPWLWHRMLVTAIARGELSETMAECEGGYLYDEKLFRHKKRCVKETKRK